MSNNKDLVEMSEKLVTSDAAIVLKEVPTSDINEDDSEDETEGADEVLDSDSEDKDLHDNASTIHGGDQDEESESLDPRIQVNSVNGMSFAFWCNRRFHYQITYIIM